jgi:hypothetical protein
MAKGVDRLAQLKKQGFCCSQMLLLMGLEDKGKTDRDLIRAVSGLASGLFSGEICGALTGGACLLGLYAGRGSAEDPEDHRLCIMVEELVTWFWREYGQSFGGIRCDDIIGEDSNACSRCGSLVLGTYGRIRSLLSEYGFDLEAEDHKQGGAPKGSIITIGCTLEKGEQRMAATVESPMSVLLADERTRTILEKHCPGMTSDPRMKMARAMTLKQIMPLSQGRITTSKIDAISADLAKL